MPTAKEQPVETPTPRIRELRQAHDMSVIQLAREFDVWPTTVQRWEKGGTIDDDVKRRLCAMWDVSVEHLMGWDR